ncbi:MAG: ABC transporter substrate-binding protein [Nitrososphaerales archaeon]
MVKPHVRPQEKGLLEMMKIRKSCRLLLALVTVLVTAAGCASPAGSPRLETLTVGLPALEQSALIYLATDQGLFAQQGLNVVVQDYATGPAALDALLAGKVDLAGTAEYPVVRGLLAGEPLGVVATSDKFENDYLVARPDRGITTPAGLRGKRVGLMRGAIVEFYLARLLELQGIPAEDVTVVDLKVDRLVPALAAGEVDAIATWQPYVGQAQAAVSGAAVLPVQSDQPAFGLLVARRPWLEEHGGRLTRFLKALHLAEELAIGHPEEAQAVVRRRLGYDAGYVAGVWPQHQFGLSLDQPLVIAMKDEAQWMIRNGLTPAASLPDFSAYIDAAALEAVKPGSVTLVR